MRVNIYAEELTDRVEVISKEIEGREYTAVRFYLYLPVTVPGLKGAADRDGNPNNVRGPFIHRAGDDDSAAVTFWGKQDLRNLLRKALALLDKHYQGPPRKKFYDDGTGHCAECGETEEDCACDIQF